MRTLFGLIIGLVVGVILIALGVSIFAYGLGQPIECGNYTNRAYCGNFPMIVGVFITLAGIVTLPAVIVYAVKVREGSDSELPGD